MLRGFTDKPLCVGFGISTPAQARAAAEKADGVIIGSKIIQLMEEDPSLAALRDFVVEVRKSLDD
jgi:tryptophan synthase alpha chain